MCIYVYFKGFLADLSYEPPQNLPARKYMKLLQCYISRKKQLTETDVLRVLFWSLFPLLWLDGADFALGSARAMVELAMALMVLKHCKAWAGCSVHPADTERRVSALRSLLPWGGMWNQVRIQRGERVVLGTEPPLYFMATLWPKVHCSQRWAEGFFVKKALLCQVLLTEETS